MNPVAQPKNFGLPALLGGAGLRPEHIDEILEKRPPFRWFEIITENFMGFGGAMREALEETRRHYKIIGHGVSMSIGSTDPLDVKMLRSMRNFLHKIKSPWASDHLCFTMVDHTNLVDLIPLPFTKETVDHVVSRLRVIQDTLELPFLVENVTRYVTVSDSEMSEAEFLTAVAEGANCGILLDITNVFLNSKFHGYDADEFIGSLPLHRVGQMHLAGWEVPEGARWEDVVDSHDAPVPPDVWALFERTIAKTGPSSVLVEWDKELPSIERLLQETQQADALIKRATAVQRAA